MSDDGQHGMTLIAFVGSVFSPYYAWARRKGDANPENHCALNVAIYSKGASRWAMTERGASSCFRTKDEFVIGPSSVAWDGQSLRIQILETSTPWAQSIKGQIRVWPDQLFNFSETIDHKGNHRWGPLAPSARVEVNLTSPDLKWSGQAYLDSNEGDEPISEGFHTWNWSRAKMRDNSTLVFYDMQWPGHEDKLLSLRFEPNGAVTPMPAAPVQRMKNTAWQIGRRMRSDAPVSLHEQLEDTPFYQRALLNFSYAGEKLLAFHETLSVPRLVSPVVQAMLPFRMPRRA
jgi:carotenoid 1,2-hydratase